MGAYRRRPCRCPSPRRNRGRWTRTQPSRLLDTPPELQVSTPACTRGHSGWNVDFGVPGGQHRCQCRGSMSCLYLRSQKHFISHECSENTRQRQCLSHKGNGNTRQGRCLGGVSGNTRQRQCLGFTKAVETQAKGSGNKGNGSGNTRQRAVCLGGVTGGGVDPAQPRVEIATRRDSDLRSPHKHRQPS